LLYDVLRHCFELLPLYFCAANNFIRPDQPLWSSDSRWFFLTAVKVGFLNFRAAVDALHGGVTNRDRLDVIVAEREGLYRLLGSR
jgi:hypothetical protein